MPEARSRHRWMLAAALAVAGLVAVGAYVTGIAGFERAASSHATESNGDLAPPRLAGMDAAARARSIRRRLGGGDPGPSEEEAGSADGASQVLGPRIEGRVTGPGGAPVDQVRVVLLNGSSTGSEGGFRPQEVATSAAAENDGTFSLEDRTRAGVEAWVTGVVSDVRWRAEPRRLGSERTGIELTLAAQRVVTVHVVDPDGVAQEEARVSLSDPTSDAKFPLGALTPWAQRALLLRMCGGGVRATDKTGTCLLPIDGPGPWALHVRPPPTRSAGLLEAVEEPWSPEDTVVRLEAARWIRGVVADAREMRMGGGHVEFRRGAGDPRPTTVEVRSDGTFALEHVSSARAQLRYVHPELPSTAEAGWIDIEAGQTEVALQTALGAELAVRVVGWPEGAVGTAFLTRAGGSRGTEHRLRADVGADGSVRFRGLSPTETYDLWVPASLPALIRDEGRGPVGFSAYRAGVRADGPTLAVPLEAGRTVTGLVTRSGDAPDLEPGFDEPQVIGRAEIRERGLLASAPIGHDGRLTLFGIPPGRWTISVASTNENRGASWVGTGELLDGASEVVIGAQAPPAAPSAPDEAGR